MKPLSQTRSQLPARYQPVPLGPDAIDLSGEYSLYTVPKPVAEAIVHHAQLTDLGRGTTAGGRPLRDAIAAKLAVCNGLTVSTDQVVVCSGGTAAVSMTMAALCDPGDDVLVPDPGWPGYRVLCMTWGLHPIGFAVGYDGRPDYESIERLLTPRTKALVVSHPSNPSGGVLDEQELQALVEFANRHDLYLVCDESCDLFRFLPGPCTGPAQYDTQGRVISLFSFAKTHALAGVRLGYSVSSAPLARAIERAQDGLLTGPSSLALVAGLAALQMDLSVVDSMTQFYRQQCETIEAVLPREVLPFRPQGGFHALLDVSHTALPNGDEFVRRCVAERQLRLAPGSLFGERWPHTVRLSLAAKEHTFGQAIERLLGFLAEHSA